MPYPAYEPLFAAFEIPGVEFNYEEKHNEDDVSLEEVRTAVEEISATVTEFRHTATSIIDTKEFLILIETFVTPASGVSVLPP